MGNAGVHVVDTATQGLKDWDRDTKRLLVHTMGVACNRIKNKAKRRLRWRTRPGKGLGGHATSPGLRGSITHRVRIKPGVINGEVGAGVDYAKYVEGWNKAGQHQPTKRHFVSFKTAPGLRKWAKRHGILTRTQSGKVKPAYLGGGLIVGGEKATTPFLEPTLKEMEGPVNKLFQRAMRRATRG
jgi:hypothetical protein